MKIVQISLPDDLARDAAEAGLLDSAQMEALLRASLKQMDDTLSSYGRITRAAALTSAPALAAIWNNPEDAAYDAL
jgi:predicted flap endonuclease-1-like 5' DNA nuclease